MFGPDTLMLLKWDIFRDVCRQDGPLLAENYIWLTVRFMMIFMQLDDKLQELRNPLYVRAYETPGIQGPGKWVTLAMFALFEEDDECLRAMAKLFENPRTGFMNHIYWEDLEDMG